MTSTVCNVDLSPTDQNVSDTMKLKLEDDWMTNHKALSYSTLIKKEIKIFLIYQEIQKGAVAKSYMNNGLLIYD